MKAKPCEHGSPTTRACIHCRRIKGRIASEKRRLRFPSKSSEYSKRWRKENPNYVSERQKEKVKKGECTRCNNQAEKGIKLCFNCRVRVTINHLGIRKEDVAKAEHAYKNKRCSICKTYKTIGKGWHFDHDHVTKAFRGILCHNCNLGIGQFKDNIELLNEAIEYLRKNKI